MTEQKTMMDRSASASAQGEKFGNGSTTTAMFRSEVLRTRKRRMTWIMFALLTVVAALFYGGFTIAHFVHPDNQDYIDALKPAKFLDNGYGLMVLFVAIMVVVFSSSLIGSEYSWNTMRPLVSRSRNRNSMLTSKWSTAAVMTLLLTAAAIVFTLVAATVGTLIIGQGFELTSSVIVDGVSATGRLFIGSAPYAALALMIAIVTRSNAAGIAIGIGIQLLEPLVFALLGALNDNFDKVAKAGLDYNQNRVLKVGPDASSYTTEQALYSAAVLGVWVAIFVVISYVVFNRRDIVSG